MRHLFIAIFSITLFMSGPLLADPKGNAAYIAKQVLHHSIDARELREIFAKLATDFEEDFSDYNVKVIDHDRFIEGTMGITSTQILAKIQKAGSASYLKRLTTQELAMIAELYRSEQSQELIENGERGENRTKDWQALLEGASKPISTNSELIKADIQLAIDEILTVLALQLDLEKLADVASDRAIIQFEQEHRRAEFVARARAVAETD